MATQYEKIKTKLKTKAGRRPLPPEEKARRLEAQKRENRRRAEARRRASVVLQHKYDEEFARLFKEEYDNLSKDSRFTK